MLDSTFACVLHLDISCCLGVLRHTVPSLWYCAGRLAGGELGNFKCPPVLHWYAVTDLVI